MKARLLVVALLAVSLLGSAVPAQAQSVPTDPEELVCVSLDLSSVSVPGGIPLPAVVYGCKGDQLVTKQVVGAAEALAGLAQMVGDAMLGVGLAIADAARSVADTMAGLANTLAETFA